MRPAPCFSVHPDEAKNEAAKKILYRGAIVAYQEYLNVAGKIGPLETLLGKLG